MQAGIRYRKNFYLLKSRTDICNDKWHSAQGEQRLTTEDNFRLRSSGDGTSRIYINKFTNWPLSSV
jgi:hypothetical protein